MANDINVKVGYTVDKNGLNELKKELTLIRTEAAQAKMSGNLKEGLEEASKAASQLEEILNNSWNNKLNQLDLSKVNAGIQKTFKNVENLRSAFVNSGKAGATAYNNFALSVLNTGVQLKKTSQSLDRMAVTFRNTVRFGISSSIFNTFTESIQKAFNYTRQLDSALNDIRIVTEKSADEMDKFAVRANSVAKDLGASTKDFTEAALIYYQQGLGNEESQARAEVTLKAANVTGQTGREVSEQLTSIWNGYKVTAEETELYIDKVAAVAAATAADLEELATGMGKVASAANIMGVDIDQLNAQLATVVSVTRQAPESVGTAFKTIYARMGDIEAGLDSEVSLGSYTEKMAQMGVNVLDANGKLRDMGDVIEEIGGKWNTMSREQQIALSQTMAGTRQYNNLLSLFDNWDMYTDAIETSRNSAGELQKEQDIYMESTAAHLQKLSTEAERTYDILFDQDLVNGFTDALTGMLSVFNDLLAGLGGGAKDFIFFGSTIASIFNKQIGGAIERQIENLETMRANLSREELQKQIISQGGINGEGITNASAIEKEIPYIERNLELQKYLTEEQSEQLTNEIAQIGALEQRIQGILQYKDIAQKLGVEIGRNTAETQENFEERIRLEQQSYKEQEENYRNLKKYTDEYKEGVADRFESRQQEKEILKSITESLGDAKVLEEDAAKFSEIQNRFAEEKKLNEDDIQFILESQKNVRDQISQRVQELKVGAKGVADEEASLLDKLVTEQTLREKNVQTMQTQIQRQKEISTIVQGLTSIVSLLTSVSGIIETINDEELDTEEKVKRIIPTLTSGLVVLIANFKSLTEFLPALTSQTNALAMAMGAEGVTAASGFGASLAGIISVAAPYVLAIGAVVAIGYALVKAYNADADAAREAAKEAENLKNEYHQIKDSYQELQDSISNYANSLNAIKKLEKGTLEWKQAVLELNEQVLELIDKYPELSKFVVSKDGALGITEQGINQLLQNQWNSVQSAYQSSNIGQMRANEASLNSAMTNFRRSIWYEKPNENRQSTFENRSFENPYTGQSVTDSTTRTSMTDKELGALWNALEKDGLAILENEKTLQRATGINEELAKALLENRKALEDLNTQIVNNTNSNKLLEMSNAQSKISQRSQDFNRLSSEDQTRVTRAFLPEIEKARDKLLESGEFNPSEDELHDMYADLMGFDKDKVEDKIGAAIFKDINGKSIEVKDSVIREILLQEAAMEKATKYVELYVGAMETLNETGKQLATQAQMTGTEYENTVNLLKSGFANDGKFDFSTATDEQLDILKQFRDREDEWVPFVKGVFKSAGYESADEFINAFDEEYNLWASEEKSAERAQNLAAKTNAEYERRLKDNAEALDVSENALRSYTEALMENNEALKEDKLEALDTATAAFEFQAGLEELADALDSNLQLLEDWKNGLTDGVEAYKAIGEVQEALKDMFGVRVSDDFIREHLEDIKNLANGDVEALEELQAAMAKDFVLNLHLNEADTAFLDSKIDEYNNTEIAIGTYLDDQPFIDGLNNMIQSGAMTSDEVQSYLNSIGYEPVFDEVTATTPSQPFNADTVVSADLPLIGNTQLATLHTSTTIDGATATMFGISNGEAGGGKKTLTGVKKVADVGSRSRAIGNRGSSGNRVGSGGSGGKKGGGGGGGSAKEPDIMEPLEKEKDRYHDINIELKQIETELDKLDKQKKKLFGQDLITNLNKRLQKLDKQIAATNDKIKIAQGETAELRNQLSGKGVSFNADGTIANYAQAYASQLNYVNSLIAQYNSMGAEAQEGFKDTVEKAKENFDKFVDNINRYDELITDEIPGLEADIQEAVDEKIDIQIEKFDMEIEIRLKLAEAERDWNEFKKKIIDEIEDDDILGNAMARLVDFSSYYKSDNTGIVQALRKQVDNTLAELNQMDNTGWSSVYGDNRTAALDDLKKYYDELSSNLMDVLELQKEIHESYIDMMDEAQDKFDEQIESYEMISDLIDHDMKLISLVYGEEAYSQLSEYYNKQQQNFNSQLDFQRQQVDFWRQQLEALEEGSDEWENAKEKWANAIEELNDLIESSIENLQDKYLNSINLIFQNLNNKITDNLGLDYIEEEWNLINQNADQYLDTINSLYGIQSLENKYLDALDQTDSISAQRQLKEIMDEELANLRERDKLTEYDVERANKRYEIALKQIALQEAQQNKTKMRLRRDSQGNYRYEYTSDANQIGQLQDELNDMYNSLYNFDKARYQDNLNQMYSVWAEFQEKMAEAAQINDPVARSERELLLQNQYEQLINGLTAQNATVRENLHESAFDDLSRLYDVNVENFQNMSDEEKDILMGDLLPYWESGVQHMTDVFAGEGGFLGVCKDAFDQLHDATKDYEDGLDELENTGRLDFESIGEGIDENIDKTQQLITDNNDLINSYEQELTAIGNVIGELDDLVAKYNEAKNAAIAATKAAYEYWSEQQRQAAAAANKANQGSGGSGSSSNGGGGSGSGSSGGSGSGDGNLVVGETATFSGKYYYDSYGTSPSGSKYSGVANGVIVDRINNNPYGIHIHSADGRYPDLGWIKKSQLSGYDTGGYTGTWGRDGRLALLHQKELVLNEEDTSNILNAVNAIRSITNILGSSVLEKLAAVTAGNFNTDLNGEVLEQNVHIDAQFPNVKDSREIEEALNNLVNMASMRANRR